MRFLSWKQGHVSEWPAVDLSSRRVYIASAPLPTSMGIYTRVVASLPHPRHSEPITSIEGERLIKWRKLNKDDETRVRQDWRADFQVGSQVRSCRMCASSSLFGWHYFIAVRYATNLVQSKVVLQRIAIEDDKTCVIIHQTSLIVDHGRRRAQGESSFRRQGIKRVLQRPVYRAQRWQVATPRRPRLQLCGDPPRDLPCLPLGAGSAIHLR